MASSNGLKKKELYDQLFRSLKVSGFDTAAEYEGIDVTSLSDEELDRLDAILEGRAKGPPEDIEKFNQIKIDPDLETMSDKELDAHLAELEGLK